MEDSSSCEGGPKLRQTYQFHLLERDEEQKPMRNVLKVWRTNEKDKNQKWINW